MEKAILVIDMPKNCSECDLHVFYQECATCMPDRWCVVGKDIEEEHLISKERPEWCPLRPVPSRYNPWHDFDGGWNACIDRILGDVRDK